MRNLNICRARVVKTNKSKKKKIVLFLYDTSPRQMFDDDKEQRYLSRRCKYHNVKHFML